MITHAYKTISLHPASFRIGCILVGIQSVPDDNFMLSTMLNAAITQLLMAQHNAAKIRYVFSCTTSNVMIPDNSSKGVEEKQLLNVNDWSIDDS